MKIRIEIDVKEGSSISNAIVRAIGKGGKSLTNGATPSTKVKVKEVQVSDAKLREEILKVVETHPGLPVSKIKAKLPKVVREAKGHRSSVVLWNLIHRTAQVKSRGSRGNRTYFLK